MLTVAQVRTMGEWTRRSIRAAYRAAPIPTERNCTRLDPATLAGFCHIASPFLYRKLLEHGERAEVVGGYCPVWETGHVWLLWRKRIVDVTATQFPRIRTPVLIVPETDRRYGSGWVQDIRRLHRGNAGLERRFHEVLLATFDRLAARARALAVAIA